MKFRLFGKKAKGEPEAGPAYKFEVGPSGAIAYVIRTSDLHDMAICGSKGYETDAALIAAALNAYPERP